jgi:hypothetical protein
MDKGYDSRETHDAFEDRNCRPIIAQIQARNARTPDDVPTYEHGRWTFAGADYKRKATKWRCPSGECQPKSVWIKATGATRSSRARRSGSATSTTAAPPSSASSAGSRTSTASRRSASGGMERVQPHADLCVLSQLASALAQARAVPLAA